MATHQTSITIPTQGRGTHHITSKIQSVVKQVRFESQVQSGICHLFIHHTSASLILCENADPDVQVDLETFMSKLVPDGSSLFIHQCEGPDDMPAHIRTILTNVSLSIPIIDGMLALGTWQGIYLWEHRTHAFQRKVTVTITH